MKPGKVFWGVAFLSAGIFLMLGKFDLLCFGSWSVWRFWPVILLLLGVVMVMGKQGLKAGVAGAAGLLLGFLVASVLYADWGPRDDGRGVVDQEFLRPWDPAIRTARLDIDAGAGSFYVEEPCTALVEAKTSSSLGEYSMRSEIVDSSADLHLTMEGNRSGLRSGGWRNRARVRLHNAPAWDLDLDIGAAQVDLDLRPYRVRNLNLDAGAAKVIVRMGQLVKESDVRITAGASSVRLEVPESAGCEIHVDAALSSKKFPGFARVSDRVYQTENYDSAERKITIRLDAGVSSLRVRRVE